MPKRSALIVVALIALSFGVGRVSAGSADPIGAPNTAETQMHTLEQIYQRVYDGGTFDTPMTTFTEPSAPPGSGTLHTLDDIYDLIGTSAHVPRTTARLCPCYGPGDDGALRKGALWPDPRFVEITGGTGDGTIMDNLTGLIWLKNANCAGEGRDWTTALNDVATLNLAGTMNTHDCGDSLISPAGHHTDWRLPNVRELLSLIDYNAYDPAFPTGTPFYGMKNDRYWSSTTVSNNSPNAWNIDFAIGTVNRNQPKMGSLYYVWPVRGGQ